MIAVTRIIWMEVSSIMHPRSIVTAEIRPDQAALSLTHGAADRVDPLFWAQGLTSPG
jgi:hypothetical protein